MWRLKTISLSGNQLHIVVMSRVKPLKEKAFFQETGFLFDC